MRYGICLPNFTDLATPDSIEAAADAAERLGWDAVWTTDHVLVDKSEAAEDYRTNYDAIQTLAWVAARHPSLRVGTSVIVVPQRNAIVMAKELATLDALSGGRVIAGVGVGWNATEFGNLGMAQRFKVRGAYLTETIGLWRHLWSGSSEPFAGQFHEIDDFVFNPLPPQGAGLPIWIGGRSEPALRRAGRLADGYHSSAIGPDGYAKRLPVIREAAEAAGRPMPKLSARVRVEFGEAKDRYYAMRGTSEEVAAEIRQWAEVGVEHLALWFSAESQEAMLTARSGLRRRSSRSSPDRSAPARHGELRIAARGARRDVRPVQARGPLRPADPGQPEPPDTARDETQDRADPQRHGYAPARRDPTHQQATGGHRAREDRRVDAHHPSPEVVRHGQLDRRVGRDRHPDAACTNDGHRDERQRERRRQRATIEPRPSAIAPKTIGAGRSPGERDAERRDRRAEARRGHEEPEARRPDIQDVVGERRDEDLEVHPERRDEPDDRDSEKHERRLANVAGALGQVREHRPDRGRPGGSARPAGARPVRIAGRRRSRRCS